MAAAVAAAGAVAKPAQDSPALATRGRSQSQHLVQRNEVAAEQALHPILAIHQGRARGRACRRQLQALLGAEAACTLAELAGEWQAARAMLAEGTVRHLLCEVGAGTAAGAAGAAAEAPGLALLSGELLPFTVIGHYTHLLLRLSSHDDGAARRSLIDQGAVRALLRFDGLMEMARLSQRVAENAGGKSRLNAQPQQPQQQLQQPQQQATAVAAAPQLVTDSGALAHTSETQVTSSGDSSTGDAPQAASSAAADRPGGAPAGPGEAGKAGGQRQVSHHNGTGGGGDGGAGGTKESRSMWDQGLTMLSNRIGIGRVNGQDNDGRTEQQQQQQQAEQQRSSSSHGKGAREMQAVEIVCACMTSCTRMTACTPETPT
jgi:hypothetical protein